MEEIKEWEKDFADKFGTASYPVDPIYNFISSAINLAVSKERERIVEMIEKHDWECFEQRYIKKDIINFINNK